MGGNRRSAGDTRWGSKKGKGTKRRRKKNQKAPEGNAAHRVLRPLPSELGRCTPAAVRPRARGSPDSQPRLLAARRRPAAQLYLCSRAPLGRSQRAGRVAARSRAQPGWARGRGLWAVLAGAESAGHRGAGWGGGDLWRLQPIRRTVPPQGMMLGPMGSALHAVNAVGRGAENKRAGWESGQAGVRPREGKREGEVPAKNCGKARLEFTLGGPGCREGAGSWLEDAPRLLRARRRHAAPWDSSAPGESSSGRHLRPGLRFPASVSFIRLVTIAETIAVGWNVSPFRFLSLFFQKKEKNAS